MTSQHLLAPCVSALDEVFNNNAFRSLSSALDIIQEDIRDTAPGPSPDRKAGGTEGLERNCTGELECFIKEKLLNLIALSLDSDCGHA